MTITALPEWPVAGDAAFAAKMDAVGVALPTTISEMNDVVTAFNFNATNSVSSSTDTIATGTTTITVDASKSYVKGMTIKQAYTTNPTIWMLGDVTAYDSGTGVLTHTVRVTQGTGTGLTGWTVSQAMTQDLIGDHEVTYNTGAGYGSTDTKIRKLGVVERDVGTAITHSTTAANGTVITVAEDGMYEIYVVELSSGVNAGVSLNSVSLTTALTTIATTERVAICGGATGQTASISRVLKLSAGDVLRMHDNSGAGTSTSAQVVFSVRKIANV